VAVIDSIRKLVDEFHVIHALVAEVAGIVVEAEALVVAFTASRARLAEAMSKAISVGCTSRAKFTSAFFEGVEDRASAWRNP
jgi:hypothetical protein